MHKSKGFTLIELLVVVAIIGVLSTIVVINVSNARAKAKDNAIKEEMNSLRAGGEMWNNANGTYSGFCADNDCNSGSSDWKKVCAAIKIQNPSVSVRCYASSSAWCIDTNLITGGNYCVDSVNKALNSTCSGTACI